MSLKSNKQKITLFVKVPENEKFKTKLPEINKGNQNMELDLGMDAHGTKIIPEYLVGYAIHDFIDCYPDLDVIVIDLYTNNVMPLESVLNLFVEAAC